MGYYNGGTHFPDTLAKEVNFKTPVLELRKHVVWFDHNFGMGESTRSRDIISSDYYFFDNLVTFNLSQLPAIESSSRGLL